MSDPVCLVTTAEFTKADFAGLLPDLGAVVLSGSHSQGRLSDDTKHVWVALDNTIVEGYDAHEIEVLTQLLGDTPRTGIVLEISSTDGSQKLAVDFVCRWVTRWRSVIDNTHGKFFSPQELSQLCETGGLFWPWP